MRYTSEEGGLLNNFAAEPKMYSAEPPNAGQQKLYVILGGAALAFVAGLCVIAVSVS